MDDEFSGNMYFAYGLNRKKGTAQRVYRMKDWLFERKKKDGTWRDAPEQSCIMIGEDWDYDEITEQEAESLKVLW